MIVFIRSVDQESNVIDNMIPLNTYSLRSIIVWYTTSTLMVNFRLYKSLPQT